MANKEHLEILRKGVTAWNRWRERNPKIKPDLSRAMLAGANLIDANLSKAIFRGANLAGANFCKEDRRSEANLSEGDFREGKLGKAILIGANCQRADFRRADLSGAHLDEVDLQGGRLGRANLHGASLFAANLAGADLRGTRLIDAELGAANLAGARASRADFDGARFVESNLSGANLANSLMSYTSLEATDLSGVKGLESVRHYDPSSIGIDTIYLSKGRIPEVFLRRAGVPESFITYMRSLVVEPIEYYSCFISYSTRDQEFADLLHSQLQSRGARVWLATEDLRIGDRFRTRIDEAIRLYDKLLLVLSKDSVKSPWVEAEVEAAFEKERKQKRTVLFPIRLDDAVMKTEEAWAADIKRTRHIGDFRDWKNHDKYKEAFGRLMRDLKAEDKGKEKMAT